MLPATQCRIVIRDPGEEYGRTLVVDEWNVDHAHSWLARNPQSAGCEVHLVEDGEDSPFPAPYDRDTIKIVPPSPELSEFTELATAGKRRSLLSVEAQAWATTLAILACCRDLDDDTIETAIPELTRWVQEGEDADPVPPVGADAGHSGTPRPAPSRRDGRGDHSRCERHPGDSLGESHDRPRSRGTCAAWARGTRSIAGPREPLHDVEVPVAFSRSVDSFDGHAASGRAPRRTARGRLSAERRETAGQG